MKKYCVLFGGLSPEHDISIITGMQLAKNIFSKFDIEKLYLGLDNNFYLATHLNDSADFKDKNNLKLKRVIFYDGALYYFSRFIHKKVCDIAGVINCCHGGVGENGDIAGFFSTLNIPITSADALSSHIAMDKSLAKQILSNIGIPTIKGVKLTRLNLNEAKELIDTFTDDLIVKPNALGSSIGVKATNKTDYLEQVEAIFTMNDDALVEERVLDIEEYNQACFLSNGELILSAIENPILKHKFLTFDDKYMTETKAKGADRIVPAKIGKKLSTTINEYTAKIYKELNFNGVVRIDYIYDKANKILYFNEVNTIPGSMAFYLYEPIGIDYISLVEKLLNNFSEQKKYLYFDTGVLEKKLH